MHGLAIGLIGAGAISVASAVIGTIASNIRPPQSNTTHKWRGLMHRTNVYTYILTEGTMKSPTALHAPPSDDATPTPWIFTGSASDIGALRQIQARPIRTVTSVCTINIGLDWIAAQEAGWRTAIQRLREEAIACNANAIIDIQVKRIRLHPNDERQLDEFVLTGMAIHIPDRAPGVQIIMSILPANAFIESYKQGIIGLDLLVSADIRSGSYRVYGQADWDDRSGNQELSITEAHAKSLESARRGIQAQLSSVHAHGFIMHYHEHRYTRVGEREAFDNRQNTIRIIDINSTALILGNAIRYITPTVNQDAPSTYTLSL